MTTHHLRLLRGGLVALVGALVAAVVWNLRRPSPSSGVPSSLAVVAPGTSRLGGFVHRKLDKDGAQRFLLEAQDMEGKEDQEVRLKVVHVTFPYHAGVIEAGRPLDAQVTSDQAVYWPQQEKAIFQGHVHVTTEDGLDLTTDELTYRGDKGVVRTEQPVQFKRNEVSGSGTGMTYDSQAAEIKLLADAFVRLEDKNGPPLEVHSQRATLKRDDGILHFIDDVAAQHGDDVLHARQVQVFFSTEDHSLVGIQAAGDAEIESRGSQAPGKPASGKSSGPRTLKGERIDVSFGPGRKPQNATAGPDAEAVMMPGPGEVAERRRIRAKFLTFAFDEDGHVVDIQGQKDCTMVTEPLGPNVVARQMSSRRFVLHLNGPKGEIETAEFGGDVQMAQGTQRGKADSAYYDAAKELMTLEQGPELSDVQDGSRLTAHTIVIGTKTGDIEAQGDVTHVVGRDTKNKGEGKKRTPFDASDKPTVATCRHFTRENALRRTQYRQNALLRSGTDELRAPQIVIDEDKDGKRKLAAGDAVYTLYHPKQKEGAAKPPEPVETRSKQMVYDERAGTLVYSGDVEMRQADIVSKSPEATAKLSADGSTIDTVVAGEPVAITQGDRKADGTQATYTPANEVLVLVGETVLLQDPAQSVQGRSLTFHVADDRILVDGREEVRTETVFKKKEPRKP